MRSVASVAKKEESMTMSVDEAKMMTDDGDEKIMMAWLKEELIDDSKIGMRYESYILGLARTC